MNEKLTEPQEAAASGSSGRATLTSRLSTLLSSSLVPLLLLILFWGMGISAQAEKSITFDELAHLTGGYSYWLHGDYRLHPENGILSQRWATFPFLLERYRFPRTSNPCWQQANVWECGFSFLYLSSNDLTRMLVLSRSMIAFAAAGLGWLIYVWSRALFGSLGGLISLFLFTFSPTVLSHGTLATSDLMAALGFTASLWSVWRTFYRLNIGSFLLASIFSGSLLLSKMSGLLIIPMGIMLIAMRLLDPSSLTVKIGRVRGSFSGCRMLIGLVLAFTLHLAIALGLMWGAYGFRYSAFDAATVTQNFNEPWARTLAFAGPIGQGIAFAREHQLLPEAYLYGLAFVLSRSDVRRAYLDGHWSDTGWWYFFPYSFLVKTPLPFLGLLVIAILATLFYIRARRRSEGRVWPIVRLGIVRTAPLITLLVCYWLASLQSHLNIGHRHLLPTYPAMFILAGGTAVWFMRKSRVMQAAVLVCVVWFLMESLAIRPHYLSYFNQFAGGPAQGYRHLVDSSLDWGQDLPGLKRWLEDHEVNHNGSTRVYLAYFGTGSPDYYKIASIPLPSHLFDYRPPLKREITPLTEGIYIVSATMLQGVYTHFWGPWTSTYEELYQSWQSVMDDYKHRMLLRGDSTEDPAAVQAWSMAVERFEDLRFARLTAFLREREPDDMVGYSILIYRLTDELLDQALKQPLPVSSSSRQKAS